jgi:antagonist of KipI
MSIVIIKPGLLETVQDLGRSGYSRLGVNPGGAMDRYACRLGNILAGNEVEEAVLEIHFPGPQILFEEDALICITGADFMPTLNDDPIPLWQPVLIRKNTVLQFPGLRSGARTYMAVHGGFKIEPWLNSYSTNLRAMAGGWKGRKLEKGDEIFFRSGRIPVSQLFRSENNFQVLPWRADISRVYNSADQVAITPGREWNLLSEESKRDLLNLSFQIDSSSDRMGYNLNGKPLQAAEQAEEMVSAAVTFGTIQLLPGGQMVVLMADHQVTGGYPRIAHIVSAHLPRLAQFRSNESISFRLESVEDAEEMYFNHQKDIQILQRASAEQLNRVHAASRS